MLQMEHTLVALDDGNDQFKLYTDDLKFKFHSHISRGKQNIGSATNDTDSPLQVYQTDDGTVFSVGQVDNPIDRNSDFGFSIYSQTLIQHALLQAGFAGGSVWLCTGLPLRSFFKSDGSLNDENITRKMKAAANSAKLLSKDSEKVKIVASLVQPEAVIAVSNYYYTEDPDHGVQVNPGAVDRTYAVVDPGGKTTDIAIVRNQKVMMDRSSTIQEGLNKLYYQARQYLEDLGFDVITENMCRLLVNDGYILERGNKRDESNWRNKTRKELAFRIFDEVVSRLGEARDIDKILLIGGTAKALEDQLLPLFYEKYGQDMVIFDDDADFANAKGMLLFLKKFYQDKFKKAKAS